MSTSSYGNPSSARSAANWARARSQSEQSRAWKSLTLRIEPAGDCRFGDTLHRKAVRRHAHRRVALLERRPRLVERARDDLVEPRVHLVLFPEVLLETLHPLEVRHDDTARVREHVGDDQHAVLLEDLVGGRGNRAVRALEDHPGLDAVCVVAGDHLLERTGCEHVAVEEEQLLVRDLLASLQIRDRAAFGTLVRE